MVLAAIGDYIKPEYVFWQVPLIALFVLGSLLGGAYLLNRMASKDLPRRQCTFGRCTIVIVLAGTAGAVTAGLVAMLVTTIAKRLGVSLNWTAMLAGGLAAIPMFFLVVYASFELSFRKAVAKAAPALGLAVLLGAVLAGTTFMIVRPKLLLGQRRIWVEEKVQEIARALQAYRRQNFHSPDTLQGLIDANMLSADVLKHPSFPNRASGFVYMPAAPGDPNSLVLCELPNDDATTTDMTWVIVWLPERGEWGAQIKDKQQLQALLNKRPDLKRLREKEAGQ